MSLPRPPGLEPRRFADFEAELLARARSWIPAWSLNESESDFGRALLAIAARFSAEIAERLDHVGDKMALGFLDWLAIRGDAARPARMPAAFKLTDTMKASVLAPRRTRMQADALGTSVSFETESDLLIVPGGIAFLVAVDPAEDAIYLPPPGLCSLAPVEPAPVKWQLKSFAAAKSPTLQLDPGIGLAEGMLIEIAGTQYEITSAKDDLVTIDPQVPEGGFDKDTIAAKVSAFRPFDGEHAGGARNMQDHVLYIGDDDLLNIQSQATIDVIGAKGLPEEIVWEYWGKKSQDDDPAWLPLERNKQQAADALVLVLRKGSIEKTAVGPSESRWIRASTAHIGGNDPLLDSDGIALRINATPADPAALPAADPKNLPTLTVFVNSTSSAATQFYPLGREPRLFDTLYLGSGEAFSKAGAVATVHFDLAASLFAALAALEVGTIGKVLAAIDSGGALNLFVLDASANPVSLADRGPLVPQDAANDTLALLSPFKPAMWSDGMSLNVAAASGNQVWMWREARPFPYYSGWVSWGALPPDPDNTTEALVPVMAASMTLVALRDGKLFLANPVSGTVSWSAMSFPPAGSTVKAIAPVAPEVPGVVQDSFLAIVETAGIATLHSVDAGGAATQLVSNVAADLRPFGIKRYLGNDVEAVAVSDDHTKMIAHRGTTTVTANLETGTTFAGAAIDGRIENALTVAYCLTATASGAPVLLAWSPFDPALNPVVFQDLADLSAGTPSAAIALLSNRAFTPGGNEGEIMAATLGGTRRSYPATAATFVSSAAFAKPAPALAAGDMIAAGTNLDIAKVDNTPPKDGLGDFNGLSFLWLDQWLDVDTVLSVVQLFDMTAPATSAQVGNTGFKLKVAAGTAPAVGSFVLVEKPSTVFVAAQVTMVSSMGIVVTLSKNLNLSLNTVVNFRVSSSATAQIFPTLALNATNDNFDLALVSPGDLYFPTLDPVRQRAIAVQDDGQTQPHAKRIALGARWGASPAAATSFVIDSAVTGWALVRSDTVTNPALSWEYWNGAGWWRLGHVDGTHNLRNSGDVSFVVPSDLKPVDWSGQTDRWVRVRLTGGDYGTEKVIAVTKNTSNGTEQTIERSHDGIRPPFALEVTVSYRAEEAVPDRLLTFDSLTLRDQSDANRTQGAMIEAFVPLIATLSRLERSPAETTHESCAPDCDCALTSMSPAPAQAPPPTPVTGATPGRAIYVGVEAELEGAPINLFFETEKEGSYDTLAPLASHALDGNRLVRLAAVDATRAMSETGLVSLVVSTAPAMAQLFGATLVWLRLAPRAGSTVWEPKLAGTYLNAVWTHAAETMTRERLGSSVGAPDLTVALARPPLLHDTLELRVREPLGIDEREALTADDPNLVKSEVENLPGDWVLWRKVDDPHDGGATDRVYALDEDTGTISFGNGLHGMIPPAGADCIVAFEYERTEPATPQGVPGNFITARETLNLATPLLNVESVTAIERSAGGVPPEPAERVLEFGAAKLRHRGRAVSAKDFEDLAREQSADVVQARCFAANGNIRLIVVMRGADPVPDRAQIRELEAMLAARAPSQAMQALSIEGPRARRLRIYLILRVATLDVAGEVERAVKAALAAYFDTEFGGSAREGWPLGASPSETDIAEALLRVPSLEGIASVARIEVDESGTETSWPDAIRASDLAMAAADGVRIDFEIAEAAA